MKLTVNNTDPIFAGSCSEIIDYTVRSSPGGFTATTSGTSAIVTVLHSIPKNIKVKNGGS